VDPSDNDNNNSNGEVDKLEGILKQRDEEISKFHHKILLIITLFLSCVSSSLFQRCSIEDAETREEGGRGERGVATATQDRVEQTYGKSSNG
jgi:hypothetical protein